MNNFETQLKAEVRRIRERIANDTEISAFIFKITASGQVNGGDVKITIELENLYDSKANVGGGAIQPVLEEYLRRNGWVQRNAPLCLPNVASMDDEIPF